MVTSLHFTAGISLHSDVHTCEFRIYAYFPVFDVILSCLSPEEGGSRTDMLSETSLVHTSIHFSSQPFPFINHLPLPTCCLLTPCCQKSNTLTKALKSITEHSFMTNFSLQLGKVLYFYHISFSRISTQDSLVSVSLKS